MPNIPKLPALETLEKMPQEIKDVLKKHSPNAAAIFRGKERADKIKAEYQASQSKSAAPSSETSKAK